VSSNYSWCFYNFININNYNDNNNNNNNNNKNNHDMKYDNENISTCVGDVGYDDLTGQILIGILNNDNTNNLKLYQLHVDNNSNNINNNNNNHNSHNKKSAPNVILKRFAHHTLKSLYNNDSNSTYVSTSILQLWHDNYTSPLSTSSPYIEHSMETKEHSLNAEEHSPPYIPSKIVHMSITHNKYPFSGTPVSVIEKNVDICCEITVVKMVYTLTERENNYNNNSNYIKHNVNSENLIRIVSASPTKGTNICMRIHIHMYIYIYVCMYTHVNINPNLHLYTYVIPVQGRVYMLREYDIERDFVTHMLLEILIKHHHHHHIYVGHYLCLIGWVYVFYVGHVDRIDYMKPFSIL
jgi:hypothetical protein